MIIDGGYRLIHGWRWRISGVIDIDSRHRVLMRPGEFLMSFPSEKSRGIAGKRIAYVRPDQPSRRETIAPVTEAPGGSGGKRIGGGGSENPAMILPMLVLPTAVLNLIKHNTYIITITIIMFMFMFGDLGKWL